MPEVVDNTICNTFLLQLADDAAIAVLYSVMSIGVSSLSVNFKNIFTYSKKKFLYVNYDKTCYMNISKDTRSDPLPVCGFPDVMPAKDNQSVYLGMLIIQSMDIVDHITANLKRRQFNVKKIHDWLDVNIDTPIAVKLNTMYGGMFAAIIYGCEAWFYIDEVAESLLKIERSLLKRILGVRSSTPNDLIYLELGIPDIIGKIRKRQKKFFEKTCLLKYSDATVRLILDLCADLPCYAYYVNIDSNAAELNMKARRDIVAASESTYSVRYSNLVGFRYCDVLYNTPMVESKRIVISRWRLSNHNLLIETGRYTRPKTPRENRLCVVCNELEDEHHAIFVCNLYNAIRVKFNTILDRYTTVSTILHPLNGDDAYKIGSLLMEIEVLRESNVTL